MKYLIDSNTSWTSNSNKATIKIAITFCLIVILGNSNAFSQNHEPVFKQFSWTKLTEFHPQPKLNTLPFSQQRKFIPFKANKSFHNYQLSDLEMNVSVYPNPTSELVNLDIPEDGTLTVYSSNGQVVLNKPVNEGSTQVILSEFPAGVYIVQLNGEYENYSSRLLIQH